MEFSIATTGFTSPDLGGGPHALAWNYLGFRRDRVEYPVPGTDAIYTVDQGYRGDRFQAHVRFCGADANAACDAADAFLSSLDALFSATDPGSITYERCQLESATPAGAPRRAGNASAPVYVEYVLVLRSLGPVTPPEE